MGECASLLVSIVNLLWFLFLDMKRFALEQCIHFLNAHRINMPMLKELN